MPDLEKLHSIPGYPGYLVTYDARVWTTRFINGRGGRRHNKWLVQRSHPYTGHLRVDMRGMDRKKHTIPVHCIMAWTFLGPQPVGRLVCHRDGNEYNNDPSNLYYGTPKDNAQDRERHKRQAAAREFEEREAEYSFDYGARDDRHAIYEVDAALGF